MINTNTRLLKRSSDGYYSAGSKNEPCVHCSISDQCHVKTKMQCELFVPNIAFQDETGLNTFANTVRIGLAWSKRLIENQIIGLYNVKKHQIFGYSRVSAIFTGQIKPTLAVHASMNHLMHELPSYQAAEALHKWQLRNYGPRIVNEEANITVLYLQRLGIEDAAAYLEGHEALRPVKNRPARSRKVDGNAGGDALHHHRAEG